MVNNNLRVNKTIGLTHHTRKVRLTEKLAKVMLWTAAGITMGTLFLIIGYILFRGFVSDVRIQYDFLAEGNTVLTSGIEESQGIIIIANNGIRLDDLTALDVSAFFDGSTENWGAISQQDIDVELFADNLDSDLSLEFKEMFFEANVEFHDKVQFKGDIQGVINAVSENSGGIGIIPANSEYLLEGTNSKAIKVRNISLVLNQEVLEAADRTRIRFLTLEQVESIFSGEYLNWAQLGGADEVITLLTYPEGSARQTEFEQNLFENTANVSGNIEVLESPEDITKHLERHPGAIGFAYQNEVREFGFNIISIERRETAVNLSLPFVTEAPRRAGRVGGISTIIINTLFMIFLTVIFAGPIGVAAAIYLTEYAGKSKAYEVLRFGTETLAGVPSIVFGLFGFILFVMYLNLGVGLLSGTLTITFMILPTIIRASEEALKSVPQTMRECSLALGATKWQTITRVVVPAAIPGILTSLILATGRAVGETAALLFTMGSDYRLARDFLSSARVMSVHLYILVREGISFERAFATGTILILIILLINFATNKLIGRMAKMQG